jgi:C1A family cysteine protease
MAVGYDDTQQTFLIRNSWGTGWGLNDNGYFMMPYSYITNQNLASDFWTVVKDI